MPRHLILPETLYRTMAGMPSRLRRARANPSARISMKGFWNIFLNTAFELKEIAGERVTLFVWKVFRLCRENVKLPNESEF